MSILKAFTVLFETDADKAAKDMAAAEKQADELADAMAKVGGIDAEGAKAVASAVAATASAQDQVTQATKASAAAAKDGLAIREQIARTAADIAEAERNLAQYLLGNEDLTADTLRLLGGQEEVTKRIEAETKALAAQMVKANREADELGDELKEADRNAQRLGGSFTGSVGKLAALAGGLVSIGAVLSVVTSRFQSVNDLVEKASRARIDVSSYDQWRRAIRDAGGNAETAASQFDALADKVGEAFGDAESDAAKALTAMGVSAKDARGNVKPTEEALLDLADSMSKVSKQTAVDSLRRLGIVDPTMVEMILKGRTELEAMLEAQRRGGALTKEQAAAFVQFRTTLNAAKDAWGGLVDQAIAAVLPALSRMLDGGKKVSEWLQASPNLVRGFGIALAIIAGIVMATYVPAMTAAAAATIAATWPILAIIAAVALVGAAFALAYEDVKAFLNGQPSLIGQLAEKYDWFRQLLEGIGKAFAWLKERGGEAWEAIKAGIEVVSPYVLKLGELVGKWLGMQFRLIVGALRIVWAVARPILSLIWSAIRLLGAIAVTTGRILSAAFRIAFEAVAAAVRPLAPVVRAVFGIIEAVGSAASNVLRSVWAAFFSWFTDKLNKAADLARKVMELGKKGLDAVGAGADAVADALTSGRQQTAAANAAPTNPRSAAQVSNSRTSSNQTTVQVDKVEVKTNATDAAGVARGVGSALGSEIRKAVQNSDDGVDR